MCIRDRSRSLELIASESWRRTHLQELISAFRSAARNSGWPLLPSDTPIQPMIIGGSAAAVALSRKLAERGLLVPAIRPPTVPRDTARLRISLSADHQLEDVERLAAALISLKRDV